MRITDRHKKPGGFRKLVNSLETTVPEKRAKILEIMKKEDPDFVAEVERCIFTFEEFANINDMIICEIVGTIKEMRTFALALFKTDQALVDKFTKNMQPPERYSFKEHTESLTSVISREQISARYRIIEKTREMENQRKFQLKKYSTAYPDN